MNGTGEDRLYPAVTALTALNVVIFFAGAIVPPLGEFLLTRGILDGSALLINGEWYRLFTAMFLHANFNHLISNMLVLFFAGGEVERKTGTLSFFIMYIVTGLCGNLLSVLAGVRQHEARMSLGASGAVFGMLGVLAVQTLLNRKRLQRGSPLRLGFGIGLSLYAGWSTPGIDQMAHVGGFIAGLLFGAAMAGTEAFRNRRNGYEKG